jgi:hypothetical protein
MLAAESAGGARRPAKTGGRQPLTKTAHEAVVLAKRLWRRNPKTGQRLSLRRIAAALAEAGHLNERGHPYNPQSVRAMLRGPQKRERVAMRLADKIGERNKQQ